MVFDHMLVPLDSSGLAECVLPHAIALARAFSARVTALTVLEPAHHAGSGPLVDPVAWHVRRAEAQVYLDTVVARLQDAGVSAESALLEGDPAQQVSAFAATHQVRLIALSSHGQGGLDGWPISSVAEKIVLRAHTAMLIVQAYQPAAETVDARYRHLMIPLDGSQRAECVLPAAVLLAEAHQAELVLVHVIRPPELLHREPLSQEDRHLMDRVVARNEQVALRRWSVRSTRI
jgi:nucleotide-binding universal stress UspA family protein